MNTFVWTRFLVKNVVTRSPQENKQFVPVIVRIYCTLPEILGPDLSPRDAIDAGNGSRCSRPSHCMSCNRVCNILLSQLTEPATESGRSYVGDQQYGGHDGDPSPCVSRVWEREPQRERERERELLFQMDMSNCIKIPNGKILTIFYHLCT